MAISDAELEAILHDLESDHVERKQSASAADRIRQAICAFSNDLPHHGKPGFLFIGVDDSGNPLGLDVTDRLLLDIGGIREEGKIQPLPTMAVEKRNLLGKDVVVVTVQPSLSPPVRYDGRVWIRVGPRRALASPDEERRLTERRQSFDFPFDQCPIRGSTLADINVPYFQNTYLPLAIASDVLSENQRTVEQQLASLRFLAPGAPLPTAAGILVLGLDPLAWIPGAYVQFARFDGFDVTALIKNQKIIDGVIGDVARTLEELLSLQIESARPQGESMQQKDIPDYPWRALREIVFNAIIHRNYQTSHAPIRISWFIDRVEIQSPGGLYGQVNEANFEFSTDYRNKVLAEAMRVLGFVDRFGVGIRRAKKMLEENGNPPAEFQFYPEQTMVTIRRRLS